MGNRSMTVVMGAQRSGKSFYTNEQIKGYIKNGGTALVHGIGKMTDWDACQHGVILDYKDHEDVIRELEGEKRLKEFRRYRKYEYIQLNSKSSKYDRVEHYNALMYGKAGKFHPANEEIIGPFFRAYVKYISNCLLVFDDATATFRSKLPNWGQTLFSRINHTGDRHIDPRYQGLGSDVILIFHSLDFIANDILRLSQDDWTFRTFKYTQEPNFERVEHYELRRHLIAAFDVVQSAPQYSFVDFRNGRSTLYSFNKTLLNYKKININL